MEFKPRNPGFAVILLNTPILDHKKTHAPLGYYNN